MVDRREPNSSSASGGRARHVAGLVLCGVVALACYSNGLGNGFCEDDHPIIVNNPLVTEPGQWGRLWLTDYWQGIALEMPYRDLLFRPVAILSYRLNHLVTGLRPFGYHLVNVLLHAVVSMVVCRFALRMTGSVACATVAGIVFAVLPIHTEAVNNVAGRAELLAALFVLLALWLFEPVRGPATAIRRARRCAVGAVAVFAALGAKETGVAVLALLPLFHFGWWRSASPKVERPGPRRKGSVPYAWGSGVAVVATAGAYVALRAVALGGQLHQPVTLTKSINALVDATVWERLCGALQLWGMYWAKTFWPRVLAVDYSINAVSLANGLLDRHVLIGLSILIVLSAIAIAAWRSGHRAPAVWLAALIVSYLPVSNTVVLIKTFFAERVWYLPSVWAALLIAWSVCVGLPRCLAHTLGGRQLVLRAVMVVVLGLSAIAFARCWVRNAEWRDNGTLFASAYRDHPQAVRTLLAYGDWRARHGRYAEGIELLERAVLIDIGLTQAHRALGEVLLDHGDAEGALEHLLIAESQIPGHPPTVARLERAAAAATTRKADLLARLERQVADQPESLDALLALVDQLDTVGRTDEAVDRLLHAEPRFAHDARYLHRTAVALVLAARRDDGILYYRRAIDLTPNDAMLRIELAMLLLDRNADGDRAEARTLVKQAADLAPDDVRVRMARAEIFVLEGRRAEAARIYRNLAASLPEAGELQQRCKLRAEFLEK